MGDHLDALLGLGSERPAPGVVGESGGSGGEADGLLTVPIHAIRPNSFQPRTEFDEAELDELAASIEQVGILQPVIVRRIESGRYELIAGERRWRAAQRAGLAEVPAIVRQADDQRSLEQAVIENLHRVDLNVLEEGAAYRQLIDEFAFTQDEVARRVGKSRSAVANTLRLLGLPGSVQRLIRTGELSAGHARALLGFPEADVQASVAARVVKEGLSVRETEDLVRAASRQSTGGKGSPKGRQRDKAAALLEIERLLADRLDTRVQASLSGARGRLVIEFADLEDLDRIFQELGGEPDLWS